MLEAIAFSALLTLPGLTFYGVVNRFVIEWVKKFIPWIDANREPHAVFLLAFGEIAAWVVAFGQHLAGGFDAQVPNAVLGLMVLTGWTVGADVVINRTQTKAAKVLAEADAEDAAKKALESAAQVTITGTVEPDPPADEPVATAPEGDPDEEDLALDPDAPAEPAWMSDPVTFVAMEDAPEDVVESLRKKAII